MTNENAAASGISDAAREARGLVERHRTRLSDPHNYSVLARSEHAYLVDIIEALGLEPARLEREMTELAEEWDKHGAELTSRIFKAESALAAPSAIPAGWPDPLESPQAQAIRAGLLDDTAIRDLFDQMERELKLHRARGAEPAREAAASGGLEAVRELIERARLAATAEHTMYGGTAGDLYNELADALAPSISAATGGEVANGERKPGFYWTKGSSGWEPAEWTAKGWTPFRSTSTSWFTDEDMGEIGPAIVMHPATSETGASVGVKEAGWQPWETVPRDDMDVLAKSGDFYQVVFWDTDENTGWHVSDADLRYPDGAFTHWRRDCLVDDEAGRAALASATDAEGK